MNYQLKNNRYTITLTSKGAELISFLDRETQREYIWQGDPQFWGRHSPVLFPFVGRLNGDQYRLGKEIYHHSQHGFARDCEFFCIEQNNNLIRFRLNSHENTLKVYPFKFSLSISYELLDHTLKISYKIENQDQKMMPFSIGGHPGFTCPILPKTEFNQYYLEFSEWETLSRHCLDQGLFNGDTEVILNQENKLFLNHDLFQDDALVFKHPRSNAISLVHQDQGKILTVHFPGFDYLGIWTKPEQDANFICIEPWLGLADQKGFSGEFQDKEGMKILSPQESFECCYSILAKVLVRV
jgi:galactose mutarotase-like enzyme